MGEQGHGGLLTFIEFMQFPLLADMAHVPMGIPVMMPLPTIVPAFLGSTDTMPLL
jgi:hypothetical protein